MPNFVNHKSYIHKFMPMRQFFFALVALISSFAMQAAITGLNVKSDTIVIDRTLEGVGSFKFTYTPGGEECNIVAHVVDAGKGTPLQEDINNIPDEIEVQPHGWALVRLTDWNTGKKDMTEVDKDGYRHFPAADASHKYSLAVASSSYGFISIAYFAMPTPDWKGTCNVDIRFKARPIDDVDGNGELNVSDTTAIINMILGDANADLVMGDFNLDGELNVSDVTDAINKILNN